MLSNVLWYCFPSYHVTAYQRNGGVRGAEMGLNDVLHHFLSIGQGSMTRRAIVFPLALCDDKVGTLKSGCKMIEAGSIIVAILEAIAIVRAGVHRAWRRGELGLC